jgi:hypothetical protein
MTTELLQLTEQANEAMGTERADMTWWKAYAGHVSVDLAALELQIS